MRAWHAAFLKNILRYLFCVLGFYGSGCNETCECQNGAQCDPVYGSCNCTDGYVGSLCENACNQGNLRDGETLSNKVMNLLYLHTLKNLPKSCVKREHGRQLGKTLHSSG